MLSSTLNYSTNRDSNTSNSEVDAPGSRLRNDDFFPLGEEWDEEIGKSEGQLQSDRPSRSSFKNKRGDDDTKNMVLVDLI